MEGCKRRRAADLILENYFLKKHDSGWGRRRMRRSTAITAGFVDPRPREARQRKFVVKR